MKIKDICEYGKKSKIKAGEGLSEGNVKFFTSSSESNKYVNEVQFSKPGIIMGTGGNATLHYSDEPFSVSTDCLVLFPKIKVSPKYLYYFFKGNFHVLQEGFKGAGLKHTSKKYIDEISINHIPNIEDQMQIVNILDSVNDIIFKKNQQISEYDQLIKSRFVEIFGDISINSKSFDIKPFIDLCFKIGDGLHGTPLYDDKGNYYFINGNNLGNDYIKITETTKKVNEEVFKKNYIQFGENTVFLSINGTLGNVALYNDEPIILGKSAAYCNLKSSLHIKFVAELFKTNKFKEYMLSNSSGTTITNFGLKAFRNFPMIVPPMILQTQFTKFVEQVDKLKFAVQKSLDETQQLFDSLMQEYFG